MHNLFCVDAAAVRLEPKGEAEVPEIIIVSDAVKGTFVNLDGRRESTRESGGAHCSMVQLGVQKGST